MNRDDAHTSHNHGFELPDAPIVVVRNDPRRWRAVAGVAVCLGLAGIVTGIVVAHRQSVSDEHLTSDALQREELRDGWKALGAAAVQDAQNTDARASLNAEPPAAPMPNVVIVNVPAQNAASGQPNVTNITVPPSATGTSSDASGTSVNNSSLSNYGSGSSGQSPYANGSTYGTGVVPVQSIPASAYSPVQGYTPASNYSPQNSYGTTTGSAAPMAPAVGNGTIPGSTPNPALPNNGLVGSTPAPGLPNAAANGATGPAVPVENGPVANGPVANAPVGVVPTSP